MSKHLGYTLDTEISSKTLLLAAHSNYVPGLKTYGVCEQVSCAGNCTCERHKSGSELVWRLDN